MCAAAPVLLVEDDTDLLDLLAECLHQHGHAVETARNGLEGLLHLYHGLRPSLVLTDAAMPIINGFDFIEGALTLTDFNSPIVLITTMTLRTLPKGVTRVLRKPLRLDEVLATVERFCGRCRCQDQEDQNGGGL